MKCYVNANWQGTERKVVNCELVKPGITTFWVKLEDGNIIKRKFKRDEVEEVSTC